MLCPNPVCLHVLRTQRPAEFRRGIGVCSDCGSDLVEALPETSSAAALSMGSARGTIAWRPWGIAGAAATLVTGLGFLALPGIDGELVRTMGGDGGWPQELPIVALGAAPWISAYALVELFAMLVPALRRRRESAAGRASLDRAADRIGVVFALAQATMAASWIAAINSNEQTVLADIPFAQQLIALTLVGGAILMRLVAVVLERFAVGGGLAFLVTLPAIVPLAGYVRSWPAALSGSTVGSLDLVLTALSLAFAVFATTFLLRAPDEKHALGAPLVGVHPVTGGSALVVSLGTAGVALPHDDVIVGLIAIILAIAFVALFLRPATIARRWRSVDPDLEAEPLVATARSARHEVLVPTLAFFGAVLAIDVMESHVAYPMGVVALLPFMAWLRDAFAEARFAGRHGATAIVGPLPSVEVAFALAAKLRAAGVDAMVRGAFVRACVPVFGTWARLSLVVPSHHASLAEERLRAIE